MKLRFADKVVFAILAAALVLLAGSLLFFQHGQIIAFYLLSAMMLASAMGVLALRDIVRSAFLLALTFLSVAGIFVLLQAEFLAVMQILIYAGAIVILMVFGIMLTQKDRAANAKYSGNFRFSTLIFVGFGLCILLLKAFLGTTWRVGQQEPLSPDVSAMAEIGRLFFNQYLIPFEVVSVILLMALIGAVAIARKEGSEKVS